MEPHFEADAFISFSHGDPHGKGDASWTQWVRALAERLEEQVRANHPEFADIQIWHDGLFDPTAHLTPGLREKVESSCIMLIVMSHYYLTSQWTRDEAKWFQDQISALAIDKDRVFVIRAQNTDAEKWPKFLCDERGHPLLGFQFYGADAIFPYGWPDFVERSEDFRRVWQRLLTVLIRRLREIKLLCQEQPAPTSAAGFYTPVESAPRRIFLHSSRKRAPERDAIKIELERNGFVPVTLSEQVVGSSDFGQEERKRQLKWMRRCDALALVTFDGDDDDEQEFEHIFDNRKDIVGPHGAPLPWVVIDRSGGRLPVEPTLFGAARIDATRDRWGDDLRAWFEGMGATASP